MKTLFATLLVFILSQFGCSGGGTTGTGGFGYKGSVLSESGSPLTDVAVIAESPSGEVIATVSTNPTGRFDFGKLQSSDAVIRVRTVSGESDEVTLSIPEGNTWADVTFIKRPDGKFDEEIRYGRNKPPKDDTSSSSSANTDKEKGNGKDPKGDTKNPNSGGAPTLSSTPTASSSEPSGGSVTTSQSFSSSSDAPSTPLSSSSIEASPPLSSHSSPGNSGNNANSGSGGNPNQGNSGNGGDNGNKGNSGNNGNGNAGNSGNNGNKGNSGDNGNGNGNGNAGNGKDKVKDKDRDDKGKGRDKAQWPGDRGQGNFNSDRPADDSGWLDYPGRHEVDNYQEGRDDKRHRDNGRRKKD